MKKFSCIVLIICSFNLNVKGQTDSIVLAGTWKSKLGIRGARRADQKRAAQEYIVNKYGIKPIQDICDAICIGDYITNNTLPTIQTDGFDWAD